MWQAVNTLVRRQYSYSESRDVPAILKAYRTGANGGRPGVEHLDTQACRANVADEAKQATNADPSPYRAWVELATLVHQNMR